MSQNKTSIPHIQKLINECYEAMVRAINNECDAVSYTHLTLPTILLV